MQKKQNKKKRHFNWFLPSNSPKRLLGFFVSALVGWWGFSHTANCAPNKGSLFGLFHVTTKQFGHSHMLERLCKWSVATCKMLCCPHLFFLSSPQPSSTAAPLNRLPPIGPGRQTLKLFCMAIHTFTDSSEMEIWLHQLRRSSRRASLNSGRDWARYNGMCS